MGTSGDSGPPPGPAGKVLLERRGAKQGTAGSGTEPGQTARGRRGWLAASGALSKVLLSPASFSALWFSKGVFALILRLDPFSQTALME